MDQTIIRWHWPQQPGARLLALQCVHEAASGHPGGSMSCMDLLTVLYFGVMRIDPDAPHAPNRDRFVLSKGHCTPALYSVLALRGFFPLDDLQQVPLHRRPLFRPPGHGSCQGR